MIAISSRKPLESDTKYAKLQWLANRSWRKNFSEIRYARFPRNEVPTIQFLTSSMAMSGEKNPFEYYCLINSDIVIGGKFLMVEVAMDERFALCATSRRFEYDPFLPMPQKTTSVDLGLDCFIALPHVWEAVSRAIPEDFRLGRPQWDTWLHGFFNHNYREHYYDFSKWGCIFHPKHERKPWTGPVLPIPWEAKDLEPPQELPMEIPAPTKASHAPAFT